MMHDFATPLIALFGAAACIYYFGMLVLALRASYAVRSVKLEGQSDGPYRTPDRVTEDPPRAKPMGRVRRFLSKIDPYILVGTSLAAFSIGYGYGALFFVGAVLLLRRAFEYVFGYLEERRLRGLDNRKVSEKLQEALEADSRTPRSPFVPNRPELEFLRAGILRCPSQWTSCRGCPPNRCKKLVGHTNDPENSRHVSEEGCMWSDEHADPKSYEQGYREGVRDSMAAFAECTRGSFRPKYDSSGKVISHGSPGQRMIDKILEKYLEER